VAVAEWQTILPATMPATDGVAGEGVVVWRITLPATVPATGGGAGAGVVGWQITLLAIMLATHCGVPLAVAVVAELRINPLAGV
jgi:hypothetical protein